MTRARAGYDEDWPLSVALRSLCHSDMLTTLHYGFPTELLQNAPNLRDLTICKESDNHLSFGLSPVQGPMFTTTRPPLSFRLRRTQFGDVNHILNALVRQAPQVFSELEECVVDWVGKTRFYGCGDSEASTAKILSLSKDTTKGVYIGRGNVYKSTSPSCYCCELTNVRLHSSPGTGEPRSGLFPAAGRPLPILKAFGMTKIMVRSGTGSTYFAFSRTSPIFFRHSENSTSTLAESRSTSSKVWHTRAIQP